MSSRLDRGGNLLDRSIRVPFELDGVGHTGLRGDTLASALLASGRTSFATSIFHGRPRGPLSAGREEPNVFAQVTVDGVSEPMLAATTVELTPGLAAQTLSGRGRLTIPEEGRERRYDRRHRHCDVLVIGAGAAGLAAADAASAGNARVVLVESGTRLGGRLLDLDEEETTIDGLGPAAWVDATEARLRERGEVELLRGATALGLYDDGLAVVAQGSRLWHLRARRLVLATGATERPIAFAGNDLPGVMLAASGLSYLRRWAVAVGERPVVFTVNDGAYETAAAMAAAGIEVAAVVDPRPRPGDAAQGLLEEHRIERLGGWAVLAAEGDEAVAELTLAPLEADGSLGGERRQLGADSLLISGGWNPAAELIAHTGTRLGWSERALAYLPPARSDDGRTRPVGACAAKSDLAAALVDGWDAGLEAAAESGWDPPRGAAPEAPAEPPPAPARALWSVAADGAERESESFVDLHRDVTVPDLRRAVAAGLRSAEHVKRFTTLGTGSDQGRTGNVLALGILADLWKEPLDRLAPTTARPPAAPASFALLAGRSRGALHDPARVTPMHAQHVAAGAVFEDVGQWKRPWYFPRDGEDLEAATLRECAAVRSAVAAMDASTLGKIDVHGPDAATFLDRMYTGVFSGLEIGTCKYGILCRPDGMVFDDGVSMRLAPDRYLVTTTTGNAAAVLEWFDEWLQTEWPDLRVHCTSVTEQWATVAIAGPRSREVLTALAPDLDTSAAGFPFMAIQETTVAGLRARVCRVSFSGELAFEVNVAGQDGPQLWSAVMAAGQPHGIVPYGTETMHVLRAEKGYFIVGQETDGTVTPQDLGYGWAISKKKRDFVGSRSHRRPDTVRADRKQLVALLPATRVVEGSQIASARGEPPVASEGHVTSSYLSAALGRPFALALLRRGRERIGETVQVSHGGCWTAAEVAEPVLYDPEGARRDG